MLGGTHVTRSVEPDPICTWNSLALRTLLQHREGRRDHGTATTTLVVNATVRLVG